MDGLCGWNGQWSVPGRRETSGHARCAQGGVETGPRPTAHLQEFVGRLQAFPISRCKADWIHQFLSPRRPPPLAPHQPLLRDGQDTSSSNTKYTARTHAARNDSWPASIMPIARVCSPPREQPQAGLEEFRRAPLNPSSTDHTTGPTQAPARLCLSRRIRLTLGRKLGTEIPNCHQGHQ